MSDPCPAAVFTALAFDQGCATAFRLLQLEIASLAPGMSQDDLRELTCTVSDLVGEISRVVWDAAYTAGKEAGRAAPSSN